MATADLVLAAAACGAGTEGSADGRVLTVWAAASLTEAFAEIGAEFEREHPGAQVRFSFGPSDGLATQIIEGAPADVYASASPKWMDAVARDGPGVTDRIDFARNSLMLITPLDDPAEIRSLQDLARPGVKLVLAAEGVPAGDYARRVLAQAGIAEAAEANVVSNEEDVKGVVQKVLLGEADAGLVYRTDVTPAVASRLIALDIPPELNVSAIYPIAVVAGSSQPELARAFVALVMAEGREALMDAGFSTARPAPD
jgi:molybdate transport system substrate-binding protein